MYKVAAFYHFADFINYADFQQPLKTACYLHNIKGIILLASEGINATIAGKNDDIDNILDFIKHHHISKEYFYDMNVKYSSAEEMPFYRIKVRLKKELITMGMPDFNPAYFGGKDNVGQYIAPEDWNDMISNPDVVLIDTRNDYEVMIGTFQNAVNPNTEKFSDFPQWVKDNEDNLKGKKIAMYCTGGIRCEKASAYMLSQGYDDVCHLQGGILKYLEYVNQDNSLWQGDCFVFDRRVAVKHGLAESDYDLCGACRYPLSDADKQHADYIAGVSCHHCAQYTSDTQKQRYGERQKQILLAQKRNDKHLG